MRVPTDLQPIVGKTELRGSLHTGSPRQAKRKTKRISSKVKALFEELREGNYRTKESMQCSGEDHGEPPHHSIDIYPLTRLAGRGSILRVSLLNAESNHQRNSITAL